MKVYFSKSKASPDHVVHEIRKQIHPLKKNNVFVEYGGGKWMGDPVEASDIFIICVPNWNGHDASIRKYGHERYYSIGKGQTTELETFLNARTSNSKHAYIITTVTNKIWLQRVTDIIDDKDITGGIKDWQTNYRHLTFNHKVDSLDNILNKVEGLPFYFDNFTELLPNDIISIDKAILKLLI